MRIRVGATTDIGQVREGNEDSYLILDPLYAVADGIGGHRGGEVASNLALQTIQRLFSAHEGDLTEQVERANRAVFERSQNDREVAGMGTTLTAALVQGPRVRLAHVGDSRAYLFRDGRLELLTEDHTLVHQMVVEGEISESDAETHPHRNVLLRALGVDGTVQVDDGIVEMQDGDRLLLCTDGVTSMIRDDQIKAVLQETKDPQEAVDRLVRAANRAGGIDNITAVILDFTEDSSRDGTREAPMQRPAKRRPVAPPPPSPQPRRRGGRTARRIGIGAGIALALVVLGIVGVRLYLDTQWFVGVSNGRVAIFRGVPAEVAGLDLNSVVVETPIRADEAQELAFYRDRLLEGITADDRDAAQAIVEQIRRDVTRARQDRR